MYYCTRVKLRFLHVYIETLTMSSQEPPKKKSKQVENQQGTLLSWVKPCTSDLEPGVVEETIRIKDQPGNKMIWNHRQQSELADSKRQRDNTALQIVSDSRYQPKNFKFPAKTFGSKNPTKRSFQTAWFGRLKHGAIL